MCKLSIIVPVYNMAADGKLEYCLNSLLNQTLLDYEIIAVDDKSTDNSLEILRRYEKENPGKFRVIESIENGRQGAARNKGIRASKGDFIGFMDADDWVLPDTYECALNKAYETGADVVGFDMCLVYEHTMVPTKRVPCNTMDQTGVINDEKRAKLILNSGPFSTKIYKRSFFFDNPFSFPEKVAYEDNATTLEVVMRIKHYEHIPEVKCFYYQHNSSTTHAITEKGLYDRLYTMRCLLESAKKWNVLDTFYKELEYVYASRFYNNTLFSYMLSDLHLGMKFVKNLGQEMKEAFPNFMENSYYLDMLDEEQKKWVRLQQKSTFVFYIYFKLKKLYRVKRYGNGNI